jgi:hypothetical protein
LHVPGKQEGAAELAFRTTAAMGISTKAGNREEELDNHRNWRVVEAALQSSGCDGKWTNPSQLNLIMDQCDYHLTFQKVTHDEFLRSTPGDPAD